MLHAWNLLLLENEKVEMDNDIARTLCCLCMHEIAWINYSHLVCVQWLCIFDIYFQFFFFFCYFEFHERDMELLHSLNKRTYSFCTMYNCTHTTRHKSLYHESRTSQSTHISGNEKMEKRIHRGSDLASVRTKSAQWTRMSKNIHRRCRCRCKLMRQCEAMLWRQYTARQCTHSASTIHRHYWRQ